MSPTATLSTRVIFRWHKGEVLALEIVTRATPADWRARCQTCQPAHAALSSK